MDGRRKYHWRVPIQTQAGRTLDRDVFAFWDPADPSTPGAIAQAAAIEAGRELKVECQTVGEPQFIE